VGAVVWRADLSRGDAGHQLRGRHPHARARQPRVGRRGAGAGGGAGGVATAEAERVEMEAPQAFRLEQFRDYLALEAGNSRHTVDNYLRDVRRLAAYAAGKGARGPDHVTAVQPREVIYFLKDLVLAPATFLRASCRERVKMSD